MNAVKKILSYFANKPKTYFREKECLYATDFEKCSRDLFWELTGEKATNPPDFVGSFRMMLGNAIENHLVDELLRRLDILGFHVLGAQIPVGESNPKWHGYADLLVQERTKDAGLETKFVCEIKTKYGFGADLFAMNPVPTDGYLAQLGLYLRDLRAKAGITKGFFLYFLLSDKNFGTVVQVNCELVDNTIFVKDANISDGTSKKLDASLDLNLVTEKFNRVYKAVAENKCPKPDYIYKEPLTDELLDSLTDAKLLKAIEGGVVIGHWAPKYSKFKDKQLQVDGIEPIYTPDEMKKLIQCYKARHPRTKKFQGN